MNDGQYRFMDELELDRIKKAEARRYYNDASDVLCPLCKVNYDENKNNNKEEETSRTT